MEKKFKKILFDIADSVSYNEQAAMEYLLEQDINIESIVEEGVMEIKKKAFFNKATALMERQQELLAKAISKIKTAIPQTLEQIESAIRQKNPAYQFRNLKELNESQLNEILLDSEILEFIDQLDKK